jgi:hypothetical protein
LAPHALEVEGVPQLVEAGAEVDSAQLPAHFQPSPKMAALDGDGLVALVRVCQGIRRAARGQRDIPGYGHIDQFSRPEN